MTNKLDQIISRKKTRSVKWDYCERIFGSKDILPMWVADMDFPSPVQVMEAIKRRAEHGIFGYTEIADELNCAVGKWQHERNAWQISEDWIVHTPGVVTSIITAIVAYTEANDSILIQTPVYHPFYSCIRENGRKLIENPLKCNDGYYEMDFDDLEQKLAQNVKMMILCSPHNPVGRVWKHEELRRLAELCIKHDVVLVSDEIHSDLIYAGNKHIPIAAVSEEISQNSVTCISPTKTFNIAGLSESMAIIPSAELRSKFQRTMKKNGAGMLNIFGLEAAEAAYTHGGKWLEELVGYLSENLEILLGYFKDNIPSIKVARPESTYLAWLDCRELAGVSGSLNNFFVREARVGLNDGLQFGRDGKGFQRLNFACPRSLLLEGLERIKGAVDKL